MVAHPMNFSTPGYVFDRDMSRLNEEFKALKTPQKAWLLNAIRPFFDEANENLKIEAIETHIPKQDVKTETLKIEAIETNIPNQVIKVDTAEKQTNQNIIEEKEIDKEANIERVW